MAPADIARLWHTVRYLRLVQIYGRLWHRLYRPRRIARPAPPHRIATGHSPLAFIARPACMLGPATFRFLNATATLSWPRGWQSASHDRLWLYNLHYFDDLTAVDAAGRTDWHRDLVARWIAENPVGHGIGWESYPTSLRIVNWIKWALAGGSSPQASGSGGASHHVDHLAALEDRFLESLATQARWLAQRIEWHLSGNHLLANAKALCCAGLYFSGPEAERWLALGHSIAARELPEQILADGGHVERSPMYHAIVLEDLLDVLNIDRIRPGVIPDATLVEWRGTVARMIRWLAAMTHPDGRIAFFNDAAFGTAAELATLETYAERLGIASAPRIVAPVQHLWPSGYIRLTGGGLCVILDVALIGPDHQPGHGHADTLSFELSIGAERIIVNGGTSVYGRGSQRQLQRGTAAHSTVEIDGENSSDVWSGFRVGRRARVRDVSIAEKADAVTVTASHDGYTRLPGKPVHQRQWRLNGRQMVVTDHIFGRYKRAVARVHLHPDVVVQAAADGLTGSLRSKSGMELSWRASAPVQLEPSCWHPEFGYSIPTTCVALALNDGHATFIVESP